MLDHDRAQRMPRARPARSVGRSDRRHGRAGDHRGHQLHPQRTVRPERVHHGRTEERSAEEAQPHRTGERRHRATEITHGHHHHKIGLASQAPHRARRAVEQHAQREHTDVRRDDRREHPDGPEHRTHRHRAAFPDARDDPTRGQIGEHHAQPGQRDDDPRQSGRRAQVQRAQRVHRRCRAGSDAVHHHRHENGPGQRPQPHRARDLTDHGRSLVHRRAADRRELPGRSRVRPPSAAPTGRRPPETAVGEACRTPSVTPAKPAPPERTESARPRHAPCPRWTTAAARRHSSRRRTVTAALHTGRPLHDSAKPLGLRDIRARRSRSFAWSATRCRPIPLRARVRPKVRTGAVLRQMARCAGDQVGQSVSAAPLTG